ncbi:hypothetical protein K502DRAFT_66503 [Neoconidiobolus thromboides FSU 785]|nr:hypothetical protein K502DRAFT_66503 [Neoconidiobolus thromboides FSU 785]
MSLESDLTSDSAIITATNNNINIEYEERLLPTLTFITYTSIIGLFIRLGLNTLFTYQNQIVIPLLYTQFVGCMILGLITPLKAHIASKHPSLYSSISSGLCGSITTFSSWNLAAFEELSFLYRKPSSVIISTQSRILGFISQILVTVSISYFGFKSGEALSKAISLENRPSILKLQRLKLSNFLSIKYTDLIVKEAVYFIIFSLFPIFLLFFTSYFLNAGRFALSAGFAPLGAYIRYLLSRLNVKYSRFPIGTLTANLIASAVLAIVTYFLSFSVDNTVHNGLSTISCISLYSISDGFCGCLSTVSTFIVISLYSINYHNTNSYL